MVRIVTAGRTDVEDYFRLSGVATSKKLNHTPFLAFIEECDAVHVVIVESAKRLLEYPDETKVMGQWRGEWRSDFFQFSVGQLRTHLGAQ